MSTLGIAPWNKGVKGYKLNKDIRGSKNPRWKGGNNPYIRREVKKRDDFTCQACGLREPDIMEVDHILPKSRFPDLHKEMTNLITLCPNCHARKTNRDIKQFKFYQNREFSRTKGQ